MTSDQRRIARLYARELREAQHDPKFPIHDEWGADRVLSIMDRAAALLDQLADESAIYPSEAAIHDGCDC